jgi:rare lipoprotein A
VSRRANANRALALLIASGSALAGPALVYASSGGAGLGGSGSSGSGKAANAPTGKVQQANVPVSASGNGIRFTTRASTLLRDPLKFTGNAGSAASGDTIEIQRKGKQTGNRWTNTAHGIASRNGSFTAVWPTNHIGQFAIRAVIIRSRSSSAASASPSVTITIFRPSIATEYGPGFYGSHTACGEVLHRNTIGVANRTLPCGTSVSIYYAGRMIVVPVIDRGPYANNADWDLTMATGKALGVPGTATIGAVSLPKSR